MCVTWRPDPIKDQPSPKPNHGSAIWDLVIIDMHERDRVGRARYGTPLQTNNGRDALVDAYQEALDLVVYLRQAIEERTAPDGTDVVERLRRVEAAAKGLADIVRNLEDDVYDEGDGYISSNQSLELSAAIADVDAAIRGS
jgi:hypothetical protein